MTKEIFEYITEWQRQVFTKATAESATKHLKEEVGELLEIVAPANRFIDIEKDAAVKAEFADCFLLLYGAASLYGMTYENICQAIMEKMEINKQRKWGEVNEQGYVKHVD